VSRCLVDCLLFNANTGKLKKQNVGISCVENRNAISRKALLHFDVFLPFECLRNPYQRIFSIVEIDTLFGEFGDACFS